MKNMIYTVVLLTIMLAEVHARGVYLEAEAFLRLAFGARPYQAQTFWIKPKQRKILSKILQYPYRKIRLKYWQEKAGDQPLRAWIVDETGKDKPITIGLVTQNSTIKAVYILVFRESRGAEVRYDFFTRQFVQLALDDENRLNKSIDGITGATLSVHALKRAAKQVLYLDSQL